MGYINTDVPELREYDTGVVLANLARIGRRLDAEMGASVAQIYELAEAIVRDAAGDLETVESILRALAADAPEEVERLSSDRCTVWDGDRPLIRRLSGHAGLGQRLILYRALTEVGGREPPPAHRYPGSPDALPLAQAARGRIAYMSNAFADNAYLAFAHRLKGVRNHPPCRAATFHSFVDACEEVYNGLCEYCILPLENTADGKLTGFSRLIVKYHLFIMAVCDVENHTLAEKNVTRFALLTRAPDAPILTLAAAPHHPRHLELLHTTTAAPSPTDLIVTATFCGLTLRRMDSLPVPESPAAPWPFCLVWDMSEATDTDISAFLTYLTLEASEDQILGIY